MSVRPEVVINMAMSADGKIASANRRVIRLGSDVDLEQLYAIRATADAILCGARTVEETRATLGNGGERFRRQRLRRGLAPYPLRLVASASGSLSETAALWSRRFSPIIVLVGRRAPRHRVARLKRLADAVWISRGATVDFASVLTRLQAEHGVRRLLVEGGGELNAALFEAGLVDEVHLTLCPLLMGGRAAPTLADGAGIPRLADAPRFTLAARRARGAELFLTYRRA